MVTGKVAISTSLCALIKGEKLRECREELTLCRRQLEERQKTLQSEREARGGVEDPRSEGRGEFSEAYKSLIQASLDTCLVRVSTSWHMRGGETLT